MSYAFLLAFAVQLLLILSASGDYCRHIPPSEPEFVHLPLSKQKRSAERPMRIRVFYDKEVNTLAKQKRDVIQNIVIPKATKFWQQALSVRSLTSPLLFKKSCPLGRSKNDHCIEKCANVTKCAEFDIPSEHLQACIVCSRKEPNDCAKMDQGGKGVKDADFIFYVTTRQNDRCLIGSTVAYAAHCRQLASNYRPLAGHVNLCPSSIQTRVQDIENLIATVKHEMLHALGFSLGLYAFYGRSKISRRGSFGIPKVDSIEHVVATRNRTWIVNNQPVTQEYKLIITPRVVEEVRNHFNCTVLEGAELENQGGEGTRHTHWEKRIFKNEAMSGTSTQNLVFSRLTFALLEDTGWYKVNYSLAVPMTWGKNLGCDFAMKSCREWMESHPEDPFPFCNRFESLSNASGCTENREAQTLCNLKKYSSPLDAKHQTLVYIHNLPNVTAEEIGYYGGPELSDYCPYMQEFTWKSDFVVRGSSCLYPENTPPEGINFALEYYGEGSRCFNHPTLWISKNCHHRIHWDHWGAGCYKYKCDQGRLHIIVYNYTYPCLKEAQVIRIQRNRNGTLHTGSVLCPKCGLFCDNCKPDVEVVSDNLVKHPYDELQCSSTCFHGSNLLLIFILFLTNVFAR